MSKIAEKVLCFVAIVGLSVFYANELRTDSSDGSQINDDRWGKKIDWDRVKRDKEESRNSIFGDIPARILPRLPNYECGSLRPPPDYLNFYSRDDRFLGYLFCKYPVKDEHYTTSKEPMWFKESLGQIRDLGLKKFPPIKWIAVMIINRTEASKANSPYPSACKVAAVFKAEEVFDSSRDLSQLIAQSEMDRKPFMYDKTQPTPGEQSRWLIVERHYAVNPTQEDINARNAYKAMIKQLRFPNYIADEILPNFKSNDDSLQSGFRIYYMIDEDYPTYLLCKYDVNEENYKQSDEPKWIKNVLSQIRRLGRKEFPPLKWVAVVVHNRKGDGFYTGDERIARRFKVGAIFNASDVFNPLCDLSQLVSITPLDHQPFVHAQEGWVQNRWMVVERHAEANLSPSEIEELKKRKKQDRPPDLERLYMPK